MVKIRLARLGRKKDPFYRIVAINETKKVTGIPLEILGTWNPREKKIDVKKAEIKKWLEKGAKMSDTVKKLYEGSN
jgi:small subunit ribosomal protein S16